MFDTGLCRGPISHRFEQVSILEHGSECIDRRGPDGKRPREFEFGTGDLNQLQELIRAIFVNEIILEVDARQLPGMAQHQEYLGLIQIESEFPDVAIFEVVVLVDFLIIRKHRKITWVLSDQSLVGEDDAARFVGARGEVDRKRHKLAVFVQTLLVDTNQGVAEHRRGIVQIRGRKNQSEFFRRNRRYPGIEIGTG